MLTFSTPSTQKKNHEKCWREKKILGKCIPQEKIMANECVEKKIMPTTNHPTLPSPPLLPLGPSEVKWLAPKCVWTSFIKRTLVVRFSQGATSSKQPLYFILLASPKKKQTNNQTDRTLAGTLQKLWPITVGLDLN